tara:strand:+ start:942 stop:1127 length:186 start_codon:yes stop_codon:yes gene_type:complete
MVWYRPLFLGSRVIPHLKRCGFLITPMKKNILKERIGWILFGIGIIVLILGTTTIILTILK